MKKHNGELEIEEDIHFEQRTWTIQRIGWVLMLLVVLAGLFGFLGRGGMLHVNNKEAYSADQTLKVEYERFLRREASSELKIDLKQLTTSAPTLFFSSDFYTKQRIDKITPEPEKVQATANGILYTFSANSPDVQIVFHTQATTFGQVNYIVQGPAKDAVTVKHFVYP